MARQTRGFWAGVLTGLALAAVVAGALALAFRLAQPPELEPAALAAPDAPAAPPPPPGAAAPAAPGSLIRPTANAPPIAGRPGPDQPPDPARLTPRDGSPSLVPLD